MLKIKETVIVEGKYDKIKLSSILDALIITTDGFGIFKNKENLELIRKMAKTNGIVILTDSDSAGFKIRSYIKGSIKEGKILNAYIPDVFGKEKRKTEYSSEGKLGVEGIDVQVLEKALKAAGINVENSISKPYLDSVRFYEDGFSGKSDSKEKRKNLCRKLSLPERLSASALIEVINRTVDEKDYISLKEELNNI